MTDKLTTTLVTILVGIIGVAIVAVIVSKQSQTAGVLQAGGSAFSSILKAALSPVSSSSNFGFGVSGFSGSNGVLNYSGSN